MNNKYLLAYLAGYIDGDGCIFIGLHKNHTKKRINLIVASTNEQVLQLFKSNFGGNINLVKTTNKSWKQQFTWTLAKTDTLKLLPNIIPFLVEKKQFAEMAIEFHQIQCEAAAIKFVEHARKFKSTSNLVQKYQKIDFEFVKNTINPTELDYAFMAGFIDAECCLSVSKSKAANRTIPYYKIMLVCNNTRAPIFKWILMRFGGTIIFRERPAPWKNQFMWRVSCNQLANHLPNFITYLKAKLPQALELIKLQSITYPNGGDRQSEAFYQLRADITNQKEIIFQTIHKLNLKGNQSISGVPSSEIPLDITI